MEKLGLFHSNKKGLLKSLQSEDFVFYLKDEQLYCLHNPGANKPNNIFTVDVLNYTTDFNKRNHGIIDDSILQEKRVSIIGLGSGGAPITLDLIRAGVTHINIMDFDTVSISNLCRTPYNLFDVGRKKIDALFEKLMKINPCAEIHIHDEDILEMNSDKLNEIIDSSDLIIEASDSIKTKILINGLAYHSKPVIYPSVYDMGIGGDILFTMPGMPCFECVFKSIMDEMKEVKKGDWDYSTGQAKPMSALIADIQVIVSRTVKLALAILTADTENSFIEKITEPGCSILFIGNEKDTFIFDKPFQEVWAETEIDPECTCQTLR